MKENKNNELKTNDLEAVAGGVLPYNEDDVIKRRNYALDLKKQAMEENDDMLMKKANRLFRDATKMANALAEEQGWEVVN